MKKIFSFVMALMAIQMSLGQTIEIDPSVKEYYVKTHKTGKGDGSDWDNAMGSKDFSYVFGNLKSDSVTFYVAAGVYHAVYNFEGKETNDKYACWRSQHGANIFGGYDSLATGNASTTKPNPSLYRTIFSGDINGDDKVVINDECGDTFENFTDNMTGSMFTMNNINSDVHISGIELTGMNYARQTAPSIISIYASNKSNCKVTVDNCKIYTSDNGLSVNNVWSLSVDKCEFINIRNSAIFSDSECRVSNSTFSYTGGVCNYGAKPNLRVTNSTFVKNSSDIQVFNHGDSTYVGAEIYNNTFISCKNPSYVTIGDNVNATIEGNIFAGASVRVEKSGFGTKRQNIKNNLFACKELDLGATATEKDNIKLEDFTSVYKYLLDGTYSASDSIFSPNLEYNGSTTRTVALLRDSVSGMSIRFPRLYEASEDQRGAYRLKSTCMGSYELGCASDTVLTTAVSVVGSKFKDGKVYDKVGHYENIIVDYKTSLGCDSVVNYILNVIPDTSRKEFYVKTQKTGKGDGSDWDNAMGPKDFALVFGNLQTEGVTFYVAAGVYHPVYDYYGKETNDKNAFWKSNYGANIFGGYDSLATGNASTTTPNPTLYRTIFSGDLNGDDKVVMRNDCDYSFENFDDNVSNSSLLKISINGDVHISGVELTGVKGSRGYASLLFIDAQENSDYKVTIDNCKLYNSDIGIQTDKAKKLEVDKCEFSNLRDFAINTRTDCHVSNSTFAHTGYVQFYGTGYRCDLLVENSTFIKNKSNINVYKNDSTSVNAQIYNNTFISCKNPSYFSIKDNVSATVIGNIFAGTSVDIMKSGYEKQQQSFANNLFACKELDLGATATEKGNIKLDDITSVYKYLLDGTYSESDTIFTPNLAYNGSSTRTVALLTDNLFDSISIRFPRLDTVSKDQRGVSRLNQTCMGAYELGCGSDTTSSTSIVMAGSKFDDGKVYDKIGRYENVFVGYKTSLGCDSVVNYTLTVVPDSSVKELYVKTRGTGKADGSDWDNAMGSKEFALVFENLQTEGVTFYMAAGVYHPVYDDYGKETNDRRAFWKSNYGANIYGGYDSLATGNASTTTPNPTLYRTIFSGDFNGDDKVVMRNDCYSYIENVDDNVKGYFLLEMSINGDVHISGVELTGVKGPRGYASLLSIDAQENSDYKVTIDNCKLYNSEIGIQTDKAKKLEVDKCEFSNLFDYSIISLTNCHISNSTFAHTGDLQFRGTGYRCDLLVENSTFIKNRSDISVYKDDSTSVNAQIYNNTFISCKNPSYFRISDNVLATVAGNIFAGTSVSINKSGLETKQQSFENNLFAGSGLNLGASATEKGNIKLEDFTSVYKYLLDGTYSESDSIFSPNLAYNGSSTRTVALLTDNLFDSISIRFPRLDTVSKDQRGVSRLNQTCMGAYELGCGSDTTSSTSKIMAGSKFDDGKVYDKVGLYKNVFVGYKTSLGCDSVVNYTLTVVPDSSVKELYVKTHGTGKADGSDWDNAMGSKEFALVFENLQTEGVTFYMAAGVYHPVYDYYGKETNDKRAFWKSNYGANIYGGYDSLATGNASTTTPNPTLYRTIFSGDFNGDDKVVMQNDCDYSFENFDDNVSNSSLLEMFINGDVHISGVELTGMGFSHGSVPSLIYIAAEKNSDYKVTIDNCKLYNSSMGIGTYKAKKLEVDKCEFSNLRDYSIISHTNCHISNSTFAHTGYVRFYGTGYRCDLLVENSTFIKNKSNIHVYKDDSTSVNAQIYNNTFISCKNPYGFDISIDDNVSATVAGNIFAGTSVTSGHGTKQQSFANNLFACKELDLGASATEKGNIKLDDITSVYKYLLDGTYSESDSIFTPNLAYNGASTRTVALLRDNLFDSISVRFPRLDTVSKDQRGVSRLNQTCMGAYELGCGSDTTFSTSIVMAGSKFEDGKVYDKIGRYENVFVGYNSSLGCDSVVNYTLTVIPDSSVKEIYVKTRGTGKADGSDWDNAMGSKDFALVFENLQTEGVTFYVAAGVYHAVYNFEGKETNDKYACWISQHGANIIGGYDSLATGNASTTTPNPTLYRTIFSGDLNGDDKVVMEDGSYFLFENFDDNMAAQMISMNINSDVHISGLELTGVAYAKGTSTSLISLNAPEENNYKVTVENCKFSVSDKGIQKVNVKGLEVNKCEFDYILNSAINSTLGCHIYNSTFAYTGGVLNYGDNSDLIVENSTFVKNAFDIQTITYDEDKLNNAKIYNNTFISREYPTEFNLGDNVLATVAGNIFAGTSVTSGHGTKQQSFENNLFAGRGLNLGASATEKGNIKLDDITSVYKYLLDGKYSESDTIFTPNLAYNGSSTRTVALLTDNLFDSISVRFPRLDTVSKDQRGVSRLSQTCMGAYEIVCIPDTIFDIRSIIVGSKFEDGKIYNNVGRYDNVISNVKKESDCDSVISYTLFVVPDSSYVIPDPSIKEYYVKTHKTGKGDGRDWDNAMGAKDFAFVFENLQTDGVTFYVAAGVYHAVYDGNGKETNDKNAHWVSQHGANIIGGYDSLTTGNATSTSNPTLYRTIFSGDINGDDKVVMEGDCDYSFENFGDNMNTSMISMKVDCDVRISGIELTGMSRGTSSVLISLSAPIGSEYSVNIDNCKLSVADKGIQVVNVYKVHVVGCEFDYISDSTFYTNANCHVVNSTFAYTNGVICDGINSRSEIVNSTFVKNSQDVHVSDNSDNSSSITGIYYNTFISCKNGGNLVVGDNVSASVAGNIFAGTPVSIIKSNYEARQQSFANNLFASKNLNLDETVLEEGNIKLDDITAIYKEILDGTYSESDSIFTPNLAYNESSTRTVALLRDNFSDETSIRFSRLAVIENDQRNVYRKDSTCMGAYEITKGDGVDDINSISFEIYPNPVKDVLSVIGCDGTFSYEIVDLTGRTISRGKSSGTIDVVGLSKGVYVLKLNYAEQQTCIRFVKQ